jgi:hypothetical protein
MAVLQRFVADLLERNGALVEAVEPDGLEVVAPAPLQAALGIPELCRLGFGAVLPAEARRVGVEGDWFDRCAAVLGDRGRSTRLVLRPDNPPLSRAERLLEHELLLANATWRLRGASPAWTRCLIFDFRSTAVSDEKRDGLLRLGVNLATGAALDDVLERLEPCLAEVPADTEPPGEAELPPLWERRRVSEFLTRAVPPRAERLIASFTASLRRRLVREQERIHDYHLGLTREVTRRLAVQRQGDDGGRRDRQRLEAVRHEYRARIDDLSRKYALKVAVEWVRTLELIMPVQRLEVIVRRRKGERLLLLDWHPLARRLEHAPCEYGHAALERTRLVCDDALHLVEPAGLAACAACARPYCRACHRDGCPKCGHS